MLRVMEPKEPYNTKEDYLEIVQEYKTLKQNEERDIWKRARLAHEAAQQYDLKQLAKDTGENYDVLKNLSYVAGKYPEEEQSNTVLLLSFKHFIVAAKADNRLEWLQKAQDNAWSAERLRREMNPPKPVEKKEPVPEPKGTISFTRVDPYGPTVPTDTREDGITIYEAAAALNYNLGQNPGEIRPWVEFYVAIVNNLFNQKTEKRMEFMMEEFVIV